MTMTQPTRLAVVFVLAAVMAALVAVASAAAAPIPRTTNLISQPTGVPDPFSDGSFLAGVSVDGSRVFLETAQKLTADDLDAGRDDIYERAGGVTTLISKPTGVPDPDTGDSTTQNVSADGSRVLFTTSQKLTTDDLDAGRTDIYERAGGVTTLISKPTGVSDPDTANVSAVNGASADGTRVFFQTTQKLTADDDDTGRQDLYERSGGVTTLVSKPTGVADPDTGAAGFWRASDDGTRVFFTTAQKMVTTDLDTNRIDLYERAGGTTTLVSQPTGVADPDTDQVATAPPQGDVSADGTRVFFSTTQKLTADDLDSTRTDVYERAAGTTTLVTGPTGVADPNTATAVFEGISADGSRVFFTTSQKLTTTDLDLGWVDVYERAGGSTTLVSQPTGVSDPDTGDATFRDVSTDGSRAVFETAQKLVTEDADAAQVDVYERAAGTTTLLSQPSGVADPDSGGAVFGEASLDGSRVFFETDQKLTADDGDTDRIDIYERAEGITSLITKAAGIADPDSADAEFAGLGPVPEVSADGSRVFFETSQKHHPGDLDAGLFDDYMAAEDTTAPQTSITGGPSGTTGDSTPGFSFAASELGMSFQCKVDGGAFAPCSSPRTLGPLADGPHSFQVRAIDPAGNIDASPAQRAFTVVTGSPFVPIGPDTLAPLGRLSGKRTQKLGKSVAVTVSCPDEACRAVATGNLKLKRATKSIRKGGKATLKLKLSKKARRAIRRALRKRRKVRAKLKVTVTDAARNSRVLRRTVRLKR